MSQMIQQDSTGGAADDHSKAKEDGRLSSELTPPPSDTAAESLKTSQAGETLSSVSEHLEGDKVQAPSSTSSNDAPEKASDRKVAAVEQASPRKPSNVPAGASLAERIAALKKSSSLRASNGRSTDRSVSGMAGTVSNTSSNGGTVGGLSSTSSLGTNEKGRSVSSGPKFGTVGSTSGAGVKDRIAKFQGSDRPLLPKSSFGSPAPMGIERNANALRPYPGAMATGGGSGAWGEGVLRPQMTGGTWVGGGEGRGWQSGDLNAPSSVRPQLTGSAWLGAGGGGSPSLNRHRSNDFKMRPLSPTNTPKSPMRQRDAFLDLEEDSSLLSSSPQKTRPVVRRDGSFSDAQLAAAQMGLSRSPKPPSTDGTAESAGENSSSVGGSREGGETMSNVSTLYDLPEAPTQELVNDEKTRVASLPSAPSTLPTIRSPQAQRAPLSNDVEIGVANVTPEKMEKLRRTASGSYANASAREDASSSQGHSPTLGRDAFLSEIKARGRDRDPSLVAARNAPSDDGASDIGRLIISSSATDDGSVLESPLDRGVDLSPRGALQRLESERVDPEQGRIVRSPRKEALPSMGANNNLTTTEGGEDSGNISIPVSLRTSSIHRREGSNESGVIDPLAADSPRTKVTKELPQVPSSTMRSVQQNGHHVDTSFDISPSASTSDPAAGLPKSNSEGLNEQQLSSINAAQQAKQAITAARSKSQRVQRLPPGRMMTAAEMDASDDEYEPGWASVTTVLSSSRR